MSIDVRSLLQWKGGGDAYHCAWRDVDGRLGDGDGHRHGEGRAERKSHGHRRDILQGRGPKEPAPPYTERRTVWSAFPSSSNTFGSANFMINYQVPDLAAMLVQLRAGGVTVLGQPESYPYGKFAWILDNDGRKVELWQPPAE
jgi:catechol 2,3-dioxygenase-like lactoylglutathione lyase family enzyme